MSASTSTKLTLVAETDNYDSDSDLSLCEEDFKENQVDIGILDVDLSDLSEDELKLFRIQMKSPFFPSKVGGKPAWLDFSNVPLSVGTQKTSDKQIELKCTSCQSQLVFLLQLYAPIMDTDRNFDKVENIDASFHRCIYVFLCSSPSCTNRTFKVLRSQLSRENEFFSYDAPPSTDLPDDNNNDQLVLAKEHLKSFYKKLNEKMNVKLCAVCGLASQKKCAKCAFSMYCSQAHQLFDWTKLSHKVLCARYENKNDMDECVSNWIEDESSSQRYVNESGTSEFLFPEREICLEPEELDFGKMKEKEKFKYDEKKVKEEMESNQGMEPDLDALKENDYDKDFERFKKISAHDSTQVLRYERGGQPLWCTKYGKLKDTDIPKCEHCGAKRIFEFQITPQLLNYLNLDESKQSIVNSLDWAGLYVYTCVRSCTSGASDSYATEFIYKQDFVS